MAWMYRLISVVLVAIEAILMLRLILPFVRVPAGLGDLAPLIVRVSDWLVAPFRAFVEPYHLDSFLSGAGIAGFGEYADRIDPAVVVAMVVYGFIGTLTLFMLRVVGRAGA
jgi:hypothetical protein